jgi:hypothetical protein
MIQEKFMEQLGRVVGHRTLHFIYKELLVLQQVQRIEFFSYSSRRNINTEGTRTPDKCR